ncbi:MAG TPA: FCD domain-containing protein, partial [Novosphingobium sp.]
RAMIESELQLATDRFAASARIAEFHQTLLELAGNKTLIVFARALRGLVDEHLNLAQRRSPEPDPEFSARQLRYGVKSHARLVDLIEARDGPGAEAHWKAHMIAAGKVWLQQVGPNSVVDLLG